MTLSSWNDGAARTAILEFVERVAVGWTVVSMRRDWSRVFAE